MIEELTVHRHTALFISNKLGAGILLLRGGLERRFAPWPAQAQVDTCATQRQPFDYTPSLSSYFLVKKHTPYQLKVHPPLTSWLGALPLNLVKYNPCHDLAFLTESSLFLSSSKTSTYRHHNFRRTSSLAATYIKTSP